MRATTTRKAAAQALFLGTTVTELVKVAGWTGERRGSVVFVHGLGGHVYDTWRRSPNDELFWPLWLARDIEGLTVYSLSYAAPASNWLGTSMPLEDRASTSSNASLVKHS